ncbi:MAG: hypothetical protein R3E32_13935 [Chitinophagales bacterium]
MFASPNLVGKLIVGIHQNVYNPSNTILQSKVEDIVNSIKSRIHKDGVEVVAISLIPNIFKLRCDVLEWTSKQNIPLSDYLQTIQKQIVKNIQYQTNPLLNDTLSDILALNHTIANSIFESANISNFSQLNQTTTTSSLSDKIIASFYLFPNPLYSKKWMDESLKLEFALILADLILTDEISFSKSRIKNELIPFLKQTIVRYGAYAIFINLWYPKEEDESNYLNSMRILAATTAMENKATVVQTTTKEHLHHLLQQ